VAGPRSQRPGVAVAGTGVFERAYRRGVPDALEPPPSRPRALPPAPFCLHGAVITPDEAWSSGYVAVENGAIAAVSQTQPSGVSVVETDGVILPGLIDLHGHPEFNVFAAWEPPKLYANRYRWRSSTAYQKLVRDPQNTILSTLPAGTQTRYAEIRALAGGVTAIQGASGASSAFAEPLVRNVDLWIFGAHKARAMIDLPSGSSRDVPRLKKILTDIGTGAVTAFYLHLCEGVPGDDRSATEFQTFLNAGAATGATNVIHGTALSEADLHTLADAGCRLVWSPQSNLRLYGTTTQASAALAAGMPVALGADWLPSGSTSLLAEMKVARRQLTLQGQPIEARDLVAMVTSVAANVAGLGDHLGSLAVGRPADLLVLERHHSDPYESVCLADPSWVELVSIGGDITYAREDWFGQLSGNASSPTIESLVAWGKPMRLDNGYQAAPGSSTPSLSQIRSMLTSTYPPVGPIYA
jgi:5-methylthioadenosine/S-adenosylhomocysteine deaminase